MPRNEELAAKLRELLVTLPILPERQETIDKELGRLLRVWGIRGRYELTKRLAYARPSGTAKAIAELKVLEHRVRSLADHIEKMHTDAHKAMRRNVDGLWSLQEQLEDFIVQSEGARRRLAKEEVIPPPKGHRKLYEQAVTTVAAEVYRRLTGRNFGRQVNPRKVGDYEVVIGDTGLPSEFLKGLFVELGISASVEGQMRKYAEEKKSKAKKTS